LDDGIVEYVLKKFGVKIGDYVEVDVSSGRKYKGYIMPKHEYSSPDILVLKLDNGYNVGISIGKIEDIRLVEPPKVKLMEVLEEDVGGAPDKKVLVMSIGGTILSKVDYVTGAVKSAVSAEELLNFLPEVRGVAEVETHVLMNKYSEHLLPSDWEIIAKEVYDRVVSGKYDGLVILHGTDTMGYTAAALSFAVQNSPIPIILVGSQRSSDRPSSDAALNLLSAIRVAAEADLAGVYVAMHLSTSDKYVAVFPGTRVRKNHTSRRDAFQAIDAQPVLVVDEAGNFKFGGSGFPKRDLDRAPVLYSKFSDKSALVKFYPGMHSALIRSLVDEGVQAIVIEGTGLGHVGEHLYDVLKFAIDRGVHIFMTSQCIWGRVNMNVYDTGRYLQRIGVVPLGNMLAETAYVKASWVLGNFDEADIDKLMVSNVCGELGARSPVWDARRDYGFEL